MKCFFVGFFFTLVNFSSVSSGLLFLNNLQTFLEVYPSLHPLTDQARSTGRIRSARGIACAVLLTGAQVLTDQLVGQT